MVELQTPEEGVALRENRGMRRTRIHAAIAIVEEHADMLRDKWRKYHD